MTKHFKRFFLHITSQSKLVFNVYLHCEWEPDHPGMMYFCEVSLMPEPGIDGVGTGLSRSSLIYTRPFTSKDRAVEDFDRVCGLLEGAFSEIPDTGLLG